MRIVHHQRLPYPGQVSIERLFAGIRKHLPPEFQLAVATSPEPSKGLSRRISNLRHAGKQVADVHHIVGDVHYLAFGLPANRLILTIHDCAALNRLTGLKRALLRYFWFAGPLRRARLVTTISAAMKSELQQHFGAMAEKVRVIPNCVRTEFTPAPKEFNHLSPVVLQVGTAWNKNVERVAAALRGSPCRLEIVGEMSSAQRQAVAATGVAWRELGSLSDAELVTAYKQCDLVIFASLYEGFGLPILEAQATGRPVITSNRSSMPEVAGDGSLMVDPESAESIRGALCSVLGQAGLRCRLIEQGFENVQRFQPQAVAARYAALYREVSATLP